MAQYFSWVNPILYEFGHLTIDSLRENFHNVAMIRFFNTLGGRIEPFEPLTPGEVKLYTCGPTVYDYPHIGNYRAYMFEDLLKRFLKYMGFEVTHVMNITDVDDKTIKGAEEQGISLQEYTKDFTAAFFDDIDTLNIDKADFYPRATDHIQEMAHMVKGLLEKGYAYEKDGSYYFSIAKFKNYGRLSKIDLESRKVGVRIDSDEYEKGKRVSRKSRFRAYESAELCFADRSEWFLANSRYQDLDFRELDCFEFAAELQKRGYATDIHYTKSLLRIIDEYKLKEFADWIRRSI